ncbi:hypothetical protein IT575_06350 [bacterium]|nr:hypothetical protein [bacterium]
MRNLAFLLSALALLLALVSSCGGGASIDGPAQGGGDLSPALWNSYSHGSLAPAGDSSLPAFPREDGSRAASANDSHSVLGADYILTWRSIEQGDALLINNGDVPPGEPQIGWAEYQIGGLAGLQALSLNVQAQPQGLDQSYFVALANFSTMSWQWFGPSSLPEMQIDLSQDNGSFISNLGNLYFVVLCDGQNTALHTQSTVVTGEGNGGLLPGAPVGLNASKGAFPDGVSLVWGPGVGADFYEVQRRDVYAFPGPDGQGAVGEWMTIGAAQLTDYFDPNLPPGVPFDYRVRSVNQNGHSAWSNIDQGFAFGPPPPGEGYPLQGTVFGYSDNSNDPGGQGVIPLAGAVLTVVSDDANVAMTTITDENGFYFVEQLMPGNYTVSCYLEGWNFNPPQVFFGVGPNMPPAWVDFFGDQGNGGGGGGGGETGMGVHGYVYGVDQNGDPNIGMTPLEGALLNVTGADGQLIMTLSSGPDGFYQFQQLPAGAYLLSCEAEGWIVNTPPLPFQVGDVVPDIRYDFFASQLQQ